MGSPTHRYFVGLAIKPVMTMSRARLINNREQADANDMVSGAERVPADIP